MHAFPAVRSRACAQNRGVDGGPGSALGRFHFSGAPRLGDGGVEEVGEEQFERAVGMLYVPWRDVLGIRRGSEECVR